MQMSRCLTSRRSMGLLTGLLLAAAAPSAARAQDDRQALIQIEVRDSIGLPLPDAKVEVFTFMDGGVFWEWVPIGAGDLPAGINLLRFSHPGYQPAVFSVPLREGGKVSLRVRLLSERDTTGQHHVVQADPVNAIGLAIEGRAKTDIVGRRRILDRHAIEGETVSHFGALMHRARNTELTVLPARGGTFAVYGRSGSGGRSCVQVMVNGDRRRVLPFETFDQLFGTHDVEAIEVFPQGSSIPMSYQVPRSPCGMLVVWFRTL